MGLKWFRAHLSLKKLKKEASRVPGMRGLYRRTSHFESNVKNEVLAKNEVSSASITSDSTAIANKEEAQHNRSKADLASQLSSSSSIDSQEHDNHENVNTNPSTSKDSDLKEQSLPQDEESNKKNKEQSDSSDNELVDSKEQSSSQKESNNMNKERSNNSDTKNHSDNEWLVI
ncbi:hypothetical protein CAJAP_06279 [Camponotus japonicus]